MNQIINRVRKELKSNVDLMFKEGAIRYFKEEVRIMGVRSPNVRQIASKYWNEVKDLDKRQIFTLSEELLKSGYLEESMIAFGWIEKLSKKYEKLDFKIFENWLKKYVSNWASCDVFCTHAFGDLITQYPELLAKVKKWTKSKNRWLRRASAVILIYPVKKKKYLDKVFATADILLLDQDDLVQKGYGWMLKEASNIYPQKVFNYVIKHKKIMPRTALRYAIEKMPLKWKQEVMKK